MFRWSDHVDWRFYEFLFLVLWSIFHYLIAVSVYPFKLLEDYSENLQRKFLLGSMLAIYAMDIGEKIVLGALFDPWYYLLLMGFLSILTVLPLVIPKMWVMRIIGWILALSLLTWSLVVRNILAG